MVKIKSAPEVVRRRDEYGAANYLVFKEGRRFLHAVTIDKQVKIVAVPKEEARYFTTLTYKGKPYPAVRACRLFLRAGKTLGISKRAKLVLNSLKGSAMVA